MTYVRVKVMRTTRMDMMVNFGKGMALVLLDCWFRSLLRWLFRGGRVVGG